MAEPLAITTGQLRGHLVGLGDLLEAQAEFSRRTWEEIGKEAILGAQETLRQETSVPFFSTRYVTSEIAAEDSLAAETHYDALVDPQDYVARDWRAGTGRLRLRWAPVTTLTTLRFSLTNQTEILDIPPAWCNVKAWKATVDVIPYGSNSVVYTTYYTMVGVLAIQQAARMTGVVPSLVHTRYTAGLVSRTSYDPDGAFTVLVRESEGLVREYQRHAGLLAAARIMRDVAREMDQGGYSVGFDGLSLSVNPSVLEQSADKREAEALKWAARLRDRTRGRASAWI